MLSSRRAPPSPGGVPVAKPRTTIQLMPRAESPVRPSNAPCPNVSREPRPAQNACRGPWLRSDERPGTRVRPGGCQSRRRARGPDVSQDSASFVPGLTSPGAGRQPRTWRPPTRAASVSDYYLACGGARRRPSITVDWTAARWKRRHRRDPCAARRPHRRKPPRCASRSTVQAGAVRCRPTPADRTLPRRA
jgi:hypothetical protein